jgi:hypothetical protein
MNPALYFSSQTPEVVAFWTAFWPSFWSGAASGVVTGLVTGLVVGFILLRYQRGIEQRASIKEYARALSVKRDELRGALSQNDAQLPHIDFAKEAVPFSAVDAIAALKDVPLTLWRENLPHESHLLDLAIQLQKSYAAFNAIASEVDQTLQQLVRAYNHQQDAIRVDDPANWLDDRAYHVFCVGMLFRFSIEQLLPWLTLNGSKTKESYIEAWTQISKDPQIENLGALLCQAREKLKMNASELLAEIDA